MAAMGLRNLVHCALSLAVTFAGLAALYLELNAEFVGFAQILVYVGAVAILIVFAILLTRGSETAPEKIYSPKWLIGLAVALLVFGVIASGDPLNQSVARTARFRPDWHRASTR